MRHSKNTAPSPKEGSVNMNRRCTCNDYKYVNIITYGNTSKSFIMVPIEERHPSASSTDLASTRRHAAAEEVSTDARERRDDSTRHLSNCSTATDCSNQSDGSTTSTVVDDDDVSSIGSDVSSETSVESLAAIKDICYTLMKKKVNKKIQKMSSIVLMRKPPPHKRRKPAPSPPRMAAGINGNKSSDSTKAVKFSNRKCVTSTHLACIKEKPLPTLDSINRNKKIGKLCCKLVRETCKEFSIKKKCPSKLSAKKNCSAKLIITKKSSKLLVFFIYMNIYVIINVYK